MVRDQSPAETSVDADLKVLIRLVAKFFRYAKSRDPEIEDLRGLLGAADLGPRHMHVLFALAMNGPTSVGPLAGHMGLSPATVSQLVNELSRSGFVQRREDELDRRRTIVSLNTNRQALIEEYAQRRLAPFRHTLEALSAEERRGFIRGWQIMVEMQEAMSSENSAQPTEQPTEPSRTSPVSRGA